MRWLLIGLLISLGVLLLAVAGMARHVLLKRADTHSRPAESTDPALDSASGDQKKDLDR